MRESIIFQDSRGSRLTLLLERLDDGRWRTWAEHSRGGRGASETHQEPRRAHRRWLEMEQAALRLGWPRKVVEGPVRTPSAMRLDANGARLFRDWRTGEYHEDGSCSRPLLGTSLAPDEVGVDSFTLAALPGPKNK